MKSQFSTHVLDNVLKKKKLQREKLRVKTIARVKSALEKLSQEVLFKEAYIFGSVIKPYKFAGKSDVDIGFIGLNDEEFFKALAILSRELGADTDIIQLEGHRFKDKIMSEGMRWTKRG